MIKEGIFDEPSVLALVERHNAHCLEDTTPCKAHRLDISQLQTPDIRFWSFWQNGEAAGCIALRDLGGQKGEIKSMHVREDLRGSGIADQLLSHLIEEAKKSQMIWLGLETGDTRLFERAIAFYQRWGFEETAPFGNYTKDNAGVLMARSIA